MKQLVDHLLKCNRAQILARSLMHCHAHDVHSIMLLESPGRTIRLFVAEPGHELWGNTPWRFERHQSVSFHAHHCELTIVPVIGQVWNWSVKHCGAFGFCVPEYQYRSAITHGKIGFERVGEGRLQTEVNRMLYIGESKYMPAEEIHTVSVPRGEMAAWFAFEGRENPAHDNRVWSMTDVSAQDFSGFYKPMSEQELDRLIGVAFSTT